MVRIRRLYNAEHCTLPQPDPLKPLLDRVTERIVGSLSGKDKDFYEREFTFFEKVTSISGALKPFIRRTKQEKKVCGTTEVAIGLLG